MLFTQNITPPYTDDSSIIHSAAIIPLHLNTRHRTHNESQYGHDRARKQQTIPLLNLLPISSFPLVSPFPSFLSSQLFPSSPSGYLSISFLHFPSAFLTYPTTFFLFPFLFLHFKKISRHFEPSFYIVSLHFPGVSLPIPFSFSSANSCSFTSKNIKSH